MKGILDYLKSLAEANPLIQDNSSLTYSAFLVHKDTQKYPLMNVQLVDKIQRDNDTIEDTVTIILLDYVKSDKSNIVYVQNDMATLALELIKTISSDSPTHAVINEPQILYLEDAYADGLAGTTMDVTIKTYNKLTNCD